MSSQGPAGGTGSGYTSSTGATGICILDGSGSQVPPGYEFSTVSIRDASDWTKYKKQALLYKDVNKLKSKDPWFVYGNAFRLETLNGENKCVPCQANAFSGGIV
jgi:hypothetical protein